MPKLTHPVKCIEKLSGPSVSYFNILRLGSIYFIFRRPDFDWYVLIFSFGSCVSPYDVV